MNPLTLALLALLCGLVGQALACGMSLDLSLRRGQSGGERRIWLALAGGTLLLALQHGYALELALRTGLYDLRQAILGGLSGLLFGLGMHALRGRQA